MTEVTGQLSMFDHPPDRQRGRRARKRQSRVDWLGPGNCRACGTRLFLYQTTDGIQAWVQPRLAPACPSCGVTLTTTTTKLTDEGQGAVS